MVDMRRIKLFESFNDPKITEEEVRGPLVELVDVGYDVLVTKTYNGYSVCISVDGEKTYVADEEYFDIANVSEPILDLIAYLQEKYGKRFVYSIEYYGITDDWKNIYGEVEIEDLEQFVKDNPLEDTPFITIDLRVN